jgi:predicted transposase YdaD
MSLKWYVYGSDSLQDAYPPPSEFQQLPGLLPFAALAKTNDQAGTLREVAKQTEAISDRRLQSNVAASSAILAGLVLEQSVIQRIFRSDIMKKSVI